VDAAPVAGGGRPVGGAPEGAAARAMFGIPGLDCINDFVTYLRDDQVRADVIGRFAGVVRPLLEGGARVDVISHSWGTVVAYEALRLLDTNAGLPDGAVLNWFTAGSALSIGEVKRRLQPRCRDGQRPQLVGRWVNLNARHDVVGGAMQGDPYAVD